MEIENVISVRIREKRTTFALIHNTVDVLVLATEPLPFFHLTKTVTKTIAVRVLFRSITFVQITASVLVAVFNAVNESVTVAVAEHGFGAERKGFEPLFHAVPVGIRVLGGAAHVAFHGG